ncbi:RnfABCDGE type electron transport complex subunit D [Oscillatoria amoena NRMC-F 0135]|nr:RnfABCDGE type electron transport complex subunit D [Oscillatoria amoena NRMC-F 0135]
MLEDPRDRQILFLSLFLIVGISTRDWTLKLECIGSAIATCLLTQSLILGCKLKMTPTDEPFCWHSLKSAAITGLSLSLLLRTQHPSTMMLAAFGAIASKFCFQLNHKHCFNPANFGIISALVLTQDAWVSPGQWGEQGWYILLFATCGGLVLQLVGRWDTTASFLGSYALLEAARNAWLGWTWDVYAHRLMSGSLLLFAFFMITDPRSIPNARIGRVLWAIGIAVLTFILRNSFFVAAAPFWALFALCPFSFLLDIAWKAPQFTWPSLSGSDRSVSKIANLPQ